MRAILEHGFLTALASVVILAGASAAYADAVTIRDPAFGLPHVCADNDLDAARQEGYQAAQDRLGQLILVTNVARGTLSGAIGLLGVGPDGDIETRRTGYSRSEYASMFNHMSASEQALLLAYCDGVNAALNEMLKLSPTLPSPLELNFFKQNVVAGKFNLFGNQGQLTLGEGGDPYYNNADPMYPASGFQFTPEGALAFAVVQIREFGFEAWDELKMAEDLNKLVTTYGASTGTELWDDRYWKNDPLQPVTVPDGRAPGFGGPLSAADPEQRMEVVAAARRLEDTVRGNVRLPGYPMRDYTKAVEPSRERAAYREALARKWGAWPSLGSYAWMIAPGRSATGNPWIGGFPQTGIQVPSIMHYTEIRGDTIDGNGMIFVGGPYVLIGHTADVAFTTTTAHLKVIDTYIEQLVNGDYNLFKYDNHGTIADMAKRIELVSQAVGAPLQIPVFRTNVKCSSNGCTKGDRPVTAFSGDVAGTVESAAGSSITDTDASFTGGAYAGGYVAIVDGTGAGQIRQISGNTTDTISVNVAFATTPDSSSQYVAVASGNNITAVAFESPVWMEESTAAAGFARFQTSHSILDMRSAIRYIPSTHNFMAADNLPYDGIGTDTGTGNIMYATSGFHRVRQNAVDDRLPLDGTAPEPFAVATGVVGSAAATSLTDTGAFTGKNYAAKPINFIYDNPDDNGEDYIVVIEAGNGYHQTRRILSNTDDTLTLEHAWGAVPSAGDAYAIYQIWSMPEAINPAEGFSANWNNKQAVANDVMLGDNGRNHRVEMMLEQLSLDDSITRDDLRNLNRYSAGIANPGSSGRYLLSRIQDALTTYGDCGTIDETLATHITGVDNGREFNNPLVVPPLGETVANTVATRAEDYIKGWATDLAADIYGDEYDPAGVSKLTGSQAVAWVLHAIDDAAGDVGNAYQNVYTGDYFNGADWKQVVHDSFCDYAAANAFLGCSDDNDVVCTTNADCDAVGAGDCVEVTGKKARSNSQYDHPLADLPCAQFCDTPLEFDPTPYGNRGTWEQIVEVGPTVKGEFMYPMGQSGFIYGFANGFQANSVRQAYQTTTMQPLWRDWRFAPMLSVCDDVTFGGDEDGDTDGDGVLDAFERWYYDGDLSNDASSDTDGDGADLATEYRWGSDPTLADTDGDTVDDGSDVAPQDRLCISGTFGKLAVKDNSTPGKDKASAKWEAPLNVCIGGDYSTACTTNADCGIGVCRRVSLYPPILPGRVVLADDSPLVDSEYPDTAYDFWKVKGDTDKGLKLTYKDKDNTYGSVTSIKVSTKPKDNLIKIKVKAKGFDLAAAPDATEGVVGLSIGTRCFMNQSSNCVVKNGALKCKAP